MNHNNSDVNRKDGTNRSRKRPLCGDMVVASSTTSLPSNIGLPLSFAIFSNVSKAFSVCPLATWNLADSGSH